MISQKPYLSNLEKDLWYILVSLPSLFDFEYKIFTSNTGIMEWEPLQEISLKPSIFQNQNNEINIISFNIRFANPDDGINIWDNRKNLVSNIILKYLPDIFGIQEGLWSQLEDIMEMIRNFYNFYAVKRKSEGSDETCAIFYRKFRFHLLDKGTFWLSESPDISGSMMPESKLPRICSWIRLFDFYNEKTIYFFNTHLDHRDISIRTKMAGVLIKQILNITTNKNIVLVGDFNAYEHELCINLVKNEFKDSCTEEGIWTFHQWNGEDACGKIDYIFYGEKFECCSFKVIKDAKVKENGKLAYPSDHFPIECCFKFKKY